MTDQPTDAEDAILLPTVYQALGRVMDDVQAISKSERNQSQKFNFRGIDTVMNAVGPAFRKHRVLCIPEVLDRHEERYQTGGGTWMNRVVVQVRFTFIGPDGNAITAATYGEAADAGDKAYSKAQSVALRVALLQSLAIPTDEPDPDSESHEAIPLAPQEVRDALVATLRALDPDNRRRMTKFFADERLPSADALTLDQVQKVQAEIDQLLKESDS